MGWDGEEGIDDDATAQQIYYGQLFWLQNHGTPEEVAKFSAGGPPHPVAADGVTGKILWFEAHPPSAEEVGILLTLMEVGGWVTSTERQRVSQLPLSDQIAEMKARMIDRDSAAQQPRAGASEPA